MKTMDAHRLAGGCSDFHRVREWRGVRASRWPATKTSGIPERKIQ
jgi:hypothetical protein